MVKCDDGGNGGYEKQNNCGTEIPYTNAMQEERVSSVLFAISAKTVVLLSACVLDSIRICVLSLHISVAALSGQKPDRSI